VTAASNSRPDAVAAGEVLVRLEGVVKHFPIRSGLLRRVVGRVHAVDGVSLEVRRGETLGIVGETGCGKSTLARCIARLFDLTAGTVEFDGHDISRLSRRRMRPLRKGLQMIFQDPIGSLNPRRRIGSIIGDPFAIHHISKGEERKRQVQELMRLVGVARALALRPKLIIADEPVSALDVSIQAQILNLLTDLQKQFGLTYIFIAHDLSVVRHVSDRIAVMYLGKIVEVATVDELYARPRHPYTNALLSAVPVPDPDTADKRERMILVGDVPSPINPPSGCRFHPRCPKAQNLCTEVDPALEVKKNDLTGHLAACHFPVEVGEHLSRARAGIAQPDREGAADLSPETFEGAFHPKERP
jgi:oligopeptide/dipeptide ABC transporter ATP-binding protein